LSWRWTRQSQVDWQKPNDPCDPTFGNSQNKNAPCTRAAQFDATRRALQRVRKLIRAILPNGELKSLTLFHAQGGENVSLADVTYACFLCRTLVYDAVMFRGRSKITFEFQSEIKRDDSRKNESYFCVLP
jgi:hypothetical protein